jgi:hypothetical protein
MLSYGNGHGPSRRWLFQDLGSKMSSAYGHGEVASRTASSSTELLEATALFLRCPNGYRVSASARQGLDDLAQSHRSAGWTVELEWPSMAEPITPIAGPFGRLSNEALQQTRSAMAGMDAALAAERRC